ncbi:MAG: hypothetical protein R3B70_18770 [Polyangiaceae bacterium]
MSTFLPEGKDPFDSGAATVLRVTFTKVPGGFRGSVQKVPTDGEPWPEEAFTAPDCDGLFHDIARLASLRVLGPPKPPPPPPSGPDAQDQPPVAAPPALDPRPAGPVASPVGRVAPEPHALPVLSPPPPIPMDLTVTVSAAVLMTAGFSADVGPALQLAGGVRYEWFSVDLELRGVFPARAVAFDQLVPEQPRTPVEFDLSQLSAQLVPCGHFATYFAGCIVAGGGALMEQDPLAFTSQPQWMLGPRFRLELPLGERFALFGFAEALFGQPPIRVFYPDDLGKEGSPGNEWVSSPVWGFFGIGASANFF